MKKKSFLSVGRIFEMLVISILLTIAVGYLLGFRAALVVGGSSEPNIHIQSLVIDYKCSYEDLKVGDYITFKEGAQTTHIIVAKAGEGDFVSYGDHFKKDDIIEFENRGVRFQRKISRNCQIVTMATNFQNYEEYIQRTQEDSNFVVGVGEGSLIECVNYSQVIGRVEHSLTNIGKIIFFIRNNFFQIIAYVIILWVGYEFMKYVPVYSKLF